MNVKEINALIERFIENGWHINCSDSTKIIHGTKIINSVEFTIKIFCSSEYSLYHGYIKIFGGDTSFERRIDFSTTDAYMVVYEFINSQEIKLKINKLDKKIHLLHNKINTLESAVCELVDLQKNTTGIKAKHNMSRTEEIYNYVNNNHNIQETAKHFGIKENTVTRYLYKYMEVLK